MPEDPRVIELRNRIYDGEQLHKKYVREYDRSYAAYRGKRQSRRRTKPSWESDLRVPYAMQVIDTALVNIISGAPRGKVRPRRQGDEAKAKAMQIALDYYVKRDHVAEKQVPFTQQALICGATVAKNQWRYQESVQRTNDWVHNPFAPGQPLRQVTERPVVLYDGPSFEPWDIRECWWEPNARDVQSCGYFVLRSWLTADELAGMAASEANPYGPYDPAATADLLRLGPFGTGPASSTQDQITGNLDRRKNRWEILEIWTNDCLYVLGNRHVLLQRAEHLFWHGQKPIVFVSARPDLFELQGIPETELIVDIQEALWTVQNMRLDNMHLTVHRGVTIRETSGIDPNEFEVKPRFKNLVTDHDDVRPFEVQPLPAEAYQETASLKADAQLVTGINPYISGSDLNTVDQNTATGVTALQEVASRLLRFKARQLSYAGYERMYEQWGELVKQFLTKPMEVRIEGPGDEFDWHTLNPQDLAGDFEYTIEGTEESLSRQQERGEIMGLLNAMAPLAALNIINWKPIIEKVGQAFDFASPEQLLQPQQPPAAPAAPTPAALPGGNGNGAMAGGPGAQPIQVPPLDPRIAQAAGLQGGLRYGQG